LLGHASHIARASGVSLRFTGASLPELPGARELWRSGVRTGGAERNERFVTPLTDWGGAELADRALALDPQTSGGLLLAVPPSVLDDYLSAVAGAVIVGSVVARGDALLVLE
jgi:selenide,water dikinase